MLKASSGSFNSSFLTAGILLIIGAGLTFFLKENRKTMEPEKTKG